MKRERTKCGTTASVPYLGPGSSPTAWRLAEVAYVKAIQVENETFYAIHGADGAPMGLFPSRDLAFATTVQHDLVPLSVH